jgi:hypothetical protein
MSGWCTLIGSHAPRGSAATPAREPGIRDSSLTSGTAVHYMSHLSPARGATARCQVVVPKVCSERASCSPNAVILLNFRERFVWI